MIIIAGRRDVFASNLIYRELKWRMPEEIEFAGNQEELMDLLTKHRKKSISHIFFTFWSWKIPEKIIKNYNCISFHASDLPNSAGGSPIQNQIMLGITETMLTAFKTTAEMDKGDILLKKKLSLEGDLRKIFDRITYKAVDMIVEIVRHPPKPKKQVGIGSYHTRRTPEQSEIKLDMTAKEAYNLVRCLNMRPYPYAFLRFNDGTILNILQAEIGDSR